MRNKFSRDQETCYLFRGALSNARLNTEFSKKNVKIGIIGCTCVEN